MAEGSSSEERSGFLNVCLLEGDAEVERRTRRGKRRAILFSILLQLLFVAALVLIPLLTKGENITGRVLIYPHVPYSAGGHQRHAVQPHHPRPNHPVCVICQQPPRIPPGITYRDATPPLKNIDDVVGDSEASRYSSGEPGLGVPFAESTRGPKPPEEPPHTAKTPVVRRSEGVQMAMLTHRVEPQYPILPLQLHREGRVELRAIISTEGMITALQVLSGDPLFIQSAVAAVREWRYKPTILDGQAVEVETRITVVYTLTR